MKSKLAIVSVLVVLMLGTVGATAGNHASAAGVPTASAPVSAMVHQNPAIFDKTRFLLHMGFAYYAFHHFVYLRYKQGSFSKGAPHRLFTLGKAAVALVFAYHEIKIAVGIANSSNSGFLHTLVKPINALGGKMNNVANSFRGGNFDPSQVTDLAHTSDIVGSQAGGIVDRAAPIPGL